jgi:hypothetical protein
MMLMRYIVYTHPMSKRLQVLMSESEYEQIRRAAAGQGSTVGEYVRRELKRSAEASDVRPADVKLRAIRKGLSYGFPTADIEQMNEEIEQGYGNGLP